MELQVIGTGSSGNAYVLRAGGSALLLDAGLPIRQLIRAVSDWKGLDGCLITHEHGDHAKSAEAVAQMGVKTYCSAGTAEAIRSDGCLTPLNAVRMLSAISVTPLRLPRSFYPTKLPYKQQNVPARHFRPFYAGTFFNPQMRLPQKRRLLPHFYHKREIRKTRKTRKRSSHHFGHDGHSASEPPLFFYAKSVDFQGFFDILSEKNQRPEQCSSRCWNGRGDRI